MSPKPFFSIITRTMPGREALLARCMASVSEQTFTCSNVLDVEHIIVRDENHAGIAAAQEKLHHVSPRGEYVFVLDDDDFLSSYDALDKLYIALERVMPEFAVVKVLHHELGNMPREWERVPEEGSITVSNVVVAHVQWYLHRTAFAPRYAGDFDFIRSLFDLYAPAWLDLNLVTVERHRAGAVEEMMAA